jgi:hypothetical protein
MTTTKKRRHKRIRKTQKTRIGGNLFNFNRITSEEKIKQRELIRKRLEPSELRKKEREEREKNKEIEKRKKEIEKKKKEIEKKKETYNLPVPKNKLTNRQTGAPTDNPPLQPPSNTHKINTIAKTLIQIANKTTPVDDFTPNSQSSSKTYSNNSKELLSRKI